MHRAPVIWTIGHSNHGFDEFVGLLREEQIENVVDVRSFPYSRFAPQFNHEEIQKRLRGAGIRYLFLGEQLGGRPTRDDHYDAEGHALYELMAQEPGFTEAVNRLLAGAADHRIAIMCSEGQPEDCHRRLLVGKVLTENGAVLRHVLPDGEVREERRVRLGDSQAALFSEDATPWRSTQSVSRRRRLSTSSAA